MIIDETVVIKVSSGNVKYWKKLGYEVTSDGRNMSTSYLTVQISELKDKSNVRVNCKCDDCGCEYTQRVSRNTDTCYECRHKAAMKGNAFGKANKGKSGLSGPDHPRWNPNKKEFQKYSGKARWLTEKTYVEYKHMINENNHPRTLCGVEGGYQLDHIISLKNAYELGISPEVISQPGNLEMLPWLENRQKGAQNV